MQILSFVSINKFDRWSREQYVLFNRVKTCSQTWLWLVWRSVLTTLLSCFANSRSMKSKRWLGTYGNPICDKGKNVKGEGLKSKWFTLPEETGIAKRKVKAGAQENARENHSNQKSPMNPARNWSFRPIDVPIVTYCDEIMTEPLLFVESS